LCCVCLIGTPGRAHSGEAAAEAKQILDVADVKGGLLVHLGCGDGALTSALAEQGAFLVHGLDSDAAQVAAARKTIRSAGMYGRVSADHLRGERLPYAENLVRLIVAEEPGQVPRNEAMRVLCPGGVLCVKTAGEWTKTVKPRPKAIDEWTHYLHDPSNNAVSQDRQVGPPERMQWVGAPRWARSHDHLATISSLVSSGGRIFYIVDEGPTAAVVLPPEWFLVARDAFSGVILWKRRIPEWEWHLRGFRSGPPNIARRLVAVGDEVYVTLGYGEPVTALDAATGETLRTYEGTAGTREILCHEGALYLVAGSDAAEAAQARAKRRGEGKIKSQRPAYRTELPTRRIMVVNAETGDTRWQKGDADTETLMPTTLALSDGRLFFQNARELLCLDAATGREVWRASRPSSPTRPAWTAPTVVAHDGVVYSADRAAPAPPKESGGDGADVQWMVTSAGGRAPAGQLIAYSAKTGERLWSTKCREGYNAPVDVLVAGGLLWTGNLVSARDPGMTQALDPRTGEVKKKRPRDQQFFKPGMSHHRCYRNKATESYVLLGRAGVEFLDVASGKAIPHHWVRGTCQYGVMPANGLLYAPSHSCACFIEAKLSGFNALAAKGDGGAAPGSDGDRLERGPAYDQAAELAAADLEASDWPTYRHDMRRTGRASCSAPPEVKLAWRAEVGAKPSSVTVAGGAVYVADVDAHTVSALNDADGTVRWQFTAGGRVDSPPTCAGGLVLFGSADGWVTCLRASDGALVWRSRAAPQARRVVSYGQLESAWPVHGSVLVTDGVAAVAAGRSSYLDGGIHLCRFDVKTGTLLSDTPVNSRDPETGQQRKGAIRGQNMPGALPDVLSTDGKSIFMRHVRFGLDGSRKPRGGPHLYSPAGFLDGSWWHRTYWLVGRAMSGGYGGWPRSGLRRPSGRILALGDGVVYGFGRDNYIHHGSHVGIDGATIFHYRKRDARRRWTRYRLFAQPSELVEKGQGRGTADKAPRWARPMPIFVRAMVLAEDKLIVAGPQDPVKAAGYTAPSEATDPGASDAPAARLIIISAQDGKRVAERELAAPPVWDGMAAAGGRLYLATTDGAVVCFGGQ
jgi:outer membrane protein assembly factor BamB